MVMHRDLLDGHLEGDGIRPPHPLALKQRLKGEAKDALDIRGEVGPGQEALRRWKVAGRNAHSRRVSPLPEVSVLSPYREADVEGSSVHALFADEDQSASLVVIERFKAFIAVSCVTVLEVSAKWIEDEDVLAFVAVHIDFEFFAARTRAPLLLQQLGQPREAGESPRVLALHDALCVLRGRHTHAGLMIPLGWLCVRLAARIHPELVRSVAVLVDQFPPVLPLFAFVAPSSRPDP
mmetsp:Transcript_38794/g.90688  ORF Transcript_38794/g.90688 Transcript_38794/m.90688 type:complete len:236 (-) Transcript_38794:312-1019(-)